jgi:hypothetical protein
VEGYAAVAQAVVAGCAVLFDGCGVQGLGWMLLSLLLELILMNALSSGCCRN